MTVPSLTWLSLRPLKFVLLAGFVIGLSCGCAATSSTNSPDSAPAAEEEEKDVVEVEEEVPNVAKCHTDTIVCDLDEALQPGLGCFCEGKDGTKIAGTAGG